MYDDLIAQIADLKLDNASYENYVVYLENKIWELETKCTELDEALENLRASITFGGEVCGR
jgi:exonuclease VII small subunit